MLTSQSWPCSVEPSAAWKAGILHFAIFAHKHRFVMHTAIRLRYSNSCQDSFFCSRVCDRLCSIFLLCFCYSEQGHWCHVIRGDLLCGVLEGAWTYHPNSLSNSFSWHFSGVCCTKFKLSAPQGCYHWCGDRKAPCLIIHISSLRQLHIAGPCFHICILTLLSAFLDAQILTSTAQDDGGPKVWWDTDITEEERGHHVPRTCHRPGALPGSLEPCTLSTTRCREGQS